VGTNDFFAETEIYQCGEEGPQDKQDNQEDCPLHFMAGAGFTFMEVNQCPDPEGGEQYQDCNEHDSQGIHQLLLRFEPEPIFSIHMIIAQNTPKVKPLTGLHC